MSEEPVVRKFAHIVHPAIVSERSDLRIAQPITFESMRVAQQFAREQIDVQLIYTLYANEEASMPPEFVQSADLTRNVTDVGEFNEQRQLALIGDILERLAATAPDADYYIYTNVDIGLQPHFYAAVNQLIDQGYDALIINRRTIPKRFQSISELPLMYAELGEKHPGHDCFIFRRDAYQAYQLGQICIGASRIGAALSLNLLYHAHNFREFKDLHLTFHIGDDRIWTSDRYNDYLAHNHAEYLKLIALFEATYPQFEHPYLPNLKHRFDKHTLPHRVLNKVRKWVRK